MLLVEQLTPLFAELAAQENLQLWLRQAIDPATTGPEVRGVLVMPPDPGVAALAQALPNIPFLTIGIPDVQASGNLSVIISTEPQPDQAGFLAGYIAATVTRDWRAGVISRGDLPAGQASSLAFNNGLIFFCGLCRPAFPPYVAYPILISLPAGAGEADFQAAVDALLTSAVRTVYIAPSAYDPALLTTLQGKTMNWIAQGIPPSELEANWIASIGIDLPQAIHQVWNDWLSGKPAVQVTPPVAITYANPTLFSPGKQDFVTRMLADLQAGYVDTGVDPSTGQPRP